MFYVATVITFSIFLELLWKSTLLVCYKLNIFCSAIMNHFDIHKLLIRPGSYRYIKWSFMFGGNLPPGSSLVSQLF